MKRKNLKNRMALLCLLMLCSSSCFIACNNSDNEGKEAEKLVEQCYSYYIDNYGNVPQLCEEIASKYLTEDFAKDYLTYMRMRYPIDLIKCSIPYDNGFDERINRVEYVGDNKVKIFFTSLDGHTFDWIITVSKVGSEYRIAKVENK